MTPGVFFRGQFRLLARTFLARFTDNEFTTTGSDLTRSVIWMIAFLMTPGVLFSVGLLPGYSSLFHLPPAMRARFATAQWTERMVFLGLTMSATGVIVAAAWDSLTLERRDALVLSALPLPARTVLFAKLAALTLFFVVVAVLTNLPTAIVYPAVVTAGNPDATTLGYLRQFAAHLGAVIAASGFIVWGAVALQGTLQATLGPRLFKRASEIAQFALGFASLLLFLLLFALARSVELHLSSYDDGAWPIVFWMPPVWFLGLYDTLMGSTVPIVRDLARLAAIALSAAMAFALGAYLIGFGRRVRRMVEGPEIAPRPGHSAVARGLALLARGISRTNEEAAIHLFTLRTLARSRVHRLGLAGALGLGAAASTYGVAALSRDGLVLTEPTPALLSVPLVLIFCGVVGLRAMFVLPSDAAAGWTFRLREPGDRLAPARAARAVLFVWIVAPVVVLAFVSALFMWSGPVAVAHAVFSAVMGALLVVAVAFRVRGIPFASRWTPGRLRLKATWPLFLFAFWTFSYRMARLEDWLLERPGAFAASVAAGIAAVAGLAWLARVSAHKQGDQSRELDESPELLLQTLNLSRPI